jgi:glutamyl/glutaminyl-tRNA synthetase
MCAPYVVRAGLMSEEEIERRRDWYQSVVAGEKERIRTYAELPERIAYLFADDASMPYDETAEKNARKHEGRVATLRDFLEWLRPRLTATADFAALNEGMRAWMKERGLKPPALLQPLRCALTGQAGGPDVFEVMRCLGPERSLRRIELALVRLA